MLDATYRPLRESGTTMIEVLVSIAILAFGLLGLAAFQLRTHITELEAFQRAQALVLVNDMVARIQANRANAANYVSTSLGTGSPNCTPTPGTPAGDQCEWSNMLQGSGEQKGTTKIGAMVGARGCITQVQAPNPAAGVCQPGIYEVSVAWQGLHATGTPANNCGAGNYGSDEALRRVISSRVAIALFNCS